MMKAKQLLSGFVGAIGLAVAGVLMSSCASSPTPLATLAEEPASGFLYRTNYQGWDDAIWMGNGQVEAIIVPSIGRVMQFRFAGEEDGPFWHKASLAGQAATPGLGAYKDFGGDKIWPAPQNQWTERMSTNWPPPVGFDGSPVEAIVDGWVVTLVYAVDEDYGIQATRQVHLAAAAPVMEITTEYTKVGSRKLEAGIWVQTQLKDPLAMFARVPLRSIYTNQFQPMSGRRVPPTLDIRDRILSIGRDTENAYTIGLDVGSILWMNDSTVLKIDSPRLPYRNYPERGASAIVSTHPNPEAFVQVGMTAPVKQMRRGDVLVKRSLYTLLRRREVDPHLEAARLLKP